MKKRDSKYRKGLFRNLYINTAVAAGLCRSSSHQHRTQAVHSTDNNRLVIDNRVNKALNLLNERLVVTLKEEPQWLFALRAVNGYDSRGVQQRIDFGSLAL